jgi:hypothetical protein
MQPRRHQLALVIALLSIGCGTGPSFVGQLGESPAPPPPPVRRNAHPVAFAAAVPPPSSSSLTLTGDVKVEDPYPNVVIAPLSIGTAADGRLRIEVQHHVGSDSQPDAVVVFLNVPARPGTYLLHTPEEPMVRGRVYAFVTTRGNALGSMKDFDSGVFGTLTLRGEEHGLRGTFHLSAVEPPSPPPTSPIAGEPAAPKAGLVPPMPPARIEADGTLVADVGAGEQRPSGGAGSDRQRRS